MDDMAKYPDLEQRNGIYRYRARVPKALKLLVSENADKWQSLIRSRKGGNSDWSSVIGKTGQLRESVVYSLKTREKREANPLY